MPVTLNTIRYHTENTPYHYTYDNNPLHDLENNDIALKNAIESLGDVQAIVTAAEDATAAALSAAAAANSTSATSPVITFSRDLVSVGASEVRRISMVTTGVQFDKLVTVVFGITATTVSTNPYTIRVITKNGSNPDYVAYQTASITGDFRDPIPFTIIKISPSDAVFLEVTNTGASITPSILAKLFTMDAQ